MVMRCKYEKCVRLDQRHTVIIRSVRHCTMTLCRVECENERQFLLAVREHYQMQSVYLTRYRVHRRPRSTRTRCRSLGSH
jgi:hypothetical protein